MCIQAPSSWCIQRSWQFYGICEGVAFRCKAISLALWSGVLKTIYHLARSIFLYYRGQSQDQYFWANTYHIVLNDFEEALGWVIAIFLPERGLELVEKSSSSEIVRGVRAPYAERAKGISLKDFAAQNQAELGTIFELSSEFTTFVLGRIEDENVRERLNLFDLKTRSDKLRYALLQPEEMREISPETFNDALPDELDLLSYRMTPLFRDIFPDTEEGKNRFEKLSSHVVQSWLNNIPRYLFLSLAPQTIQELDFSKLSQDQASDLFYAGEPDPCFGALSLRQKLDLEKKFSTDFMEEGGGLPLELLAFIPLEELKHFKLSHLWGVLLEKFFPESDLGRERFQALSSAQVQSLFSELPKYLRPLVTNQQFEGFDLFNEKDGSSRIGTNTIANIFPNDPGGEARFAQVSIDLIQRLLGYLPDYLVFSLPQKILRKLDFSSLSDKQMYDLFFIHEEAGRKCFQDLHVEQQLSIEESYLRFIETNCLKFYSQGLSWEWLACVDPKELKRFQLSHLRSSDWESLFPKSKRGRERFMEAFLPEERNSLSRDVLPVYLQDIRSSEIQQML